MPLVKSERDWYYGQIEKLDPKGSVVSVDRVNDRLLYDSSIRCDESSQRPATGEEVVRALALCMLVGKDLRYQATRFYIEKYYKHGHPSSKHDEVDLVIFDEDDLPYAMWDFKSAEEYDKDPDEFIRYQLFGTAPLVGGPKLLVYATIKPGGETPGLTLICIDYTKHQSFESWAQAGRLHTSSFPQAYSDPAYRPLIQGDTPDLRTDCSQADFRAVAATFHTEFFGEHPDNTLYTSLMKCLLAKIYDEKQTKTGQVYGFQVLHKNAKEEPAVEVFARVNELYKTAYARYIEPNAPQPDEINPQDFPPERVKTVVKVLQAMSITRGAALHADIIGAFFEEILRAGFKQDKGMYFTHDNLVWFMLEALDLDSLATQTWKKATHPENRLPYVIDPACGSGSFLLRAMHMVTNAIRSRQTALVTDMEAKEFFEARMADSRPNHWAEHFIYGMDPKFVMAITAKVNMVLHGDGSAHIFKYDALKPFATFADDKLKPAGEPQRSVPITRYKPDVAESFDLVVSNPPFGITLASETKAAVPRTFTISKTAPSEAFFLERWYQLLKPGGRLGVVIPESLLNTADSADIRLFLYRVFWIRAIVALPRNLFVETPTLTSLLFAQKKSAEEIAAWDDSWSQASTEAGETVNKAKAFLASTTREPALGPHEIEQGVMAELSPLVTANTWIAKKGKGILRFPLPTGTTTASEAREYYRALLKLAAFDVVVRNHVFGQVCSKFDYEYPVYLVEEVGYKLSKRKERLRPNQLCRFMGLSSDRETPNLHLADEAIEIVVDVAEPQRILDYMRRDVKWS